jgi:hypothetical protein
MVMGRHPDSLDSLPKNWCEKIISLYAEGASDVEVKAWIIKQRGSCSNGLWYRWLKDYKEFSQTIKKGKILSEAYWVELGHKNLNNKNFNYVGWYINMKNRFGWSDAGKTEKTNDTEKEAFEILGKKVELCNENEIEIDLSSLPEGWQGEILSLYEIGASDVEIMAWIIKQVGFFTDDLWDSWLKKYGIFLETVENGKVLSESYWADLGRKNISNKDFSFVGWYMNMKNRFGWSDTGKNKNINNISKEIFEILGKKIEF